MTEVRKDLSLDAKVPQDIKLKVLLTLLASPEVWDISPRDGETRAALFEIAGDAHDIAVSAGITIDEYKMVNSKEYRKTLVQALQPQISEISKIPSVDFKTTSPSKAQDRTGAQDSDLANAAPVQKPSIAKPSTDIVTTSAPVQVITLLLVIIGASGCLAWLTIGRKRRKP